MKCKKKMTHITLSLPTFHASCSTWTSTSLLEQCKPLFGFHWCSTCQSSQPAAVRFTRFSTAVSWCLRYWLDFYRLLQSQLLVSQSMLNQRSLKLEEILSTTNLVDLPDVPSFKRSLPPWKINMRALGFYPLALDWSTGELATYKPILLLFQFCAVALVVFTYIQQYSKRQLTSEKKCPSSQLSYQWCFVRCFSYRCCKPVDRSSSFF